MHTTGAAKAVRTAAVHAHAGIEGRGTTESISGWRPGPHASPKEQLK
jgi:hypothetical protein